MKDGVHVTGVGDEFVEVGSLEYSNFMGDQVMRMVQNRHQKSKLESRIKKDTQLRTKGGRQQGGTIATL